MRATERPRAAFRKGAGGLVIVAGTMLGALSMAGPAVALTRGAPALHEGLRGAGPAEPLQDPRRPADDGARAPGAAGSSASPVEGAASGPSQHQAVQHPSGQHALPPPPETQPWRGPEPVASLQWRLTGIAPAPPCTARRHPWQPDRVMLDCGPTAPR